MMAIAQPRRLLSTQELSVTYDRTASLPLRFHFGTTGGNHFLSVSGDQTVVRVSLVNSSGNPDSSLKFAPVPLIWSVPPAQSPLVVLEDDQTISFQVPTPVSYFTPWAFRLNIDDENQQLHGINSPLFFLISSPSSSDQQGSSLVYSPDDGSFTLDGAFELVNELVLVNAIVPFMISMSLTGATFFNLSGDDPTPLVWSSGNAPTGITVGFDPAQPDTLTLTIAASAAGVSAGFRVAVEHEGNQVLSPDPILINATLGDGNG